jgi:type II secretory pathway component PulF
MAIFIYEAYNREGAIVHGEYEGLSRDEVSAHLFKRDLTPVSIDILSVHGSVKNIFAPIIVITYGYPFVTLCFYIIT